MPYYARPTAITAALTAGLLAAQHHSEHPKTDQPLEWHQRQDLFNRLSGFTVPALRAWARTHNLTGYAGLRRDDLVQLLLDTIMDGSNARVREALEFDPRQPVEPKIKRPVARPLTRLHVITEYACSNGGVSERHDYLLLFRAGTPVEHVPPELLDQAVVVAETAAGRGTICVGPLVEPPSGHVGWMAGGSYVTGDSNFTSEIQRATGVRFHGAASLHDRSETVRQYNEMSKD